MCRLIQVLQAISVDSIVDITLELRIVTLLVIVRKGLHILSNMATEDIFAKNFCIELLTLDVVSRETGLGMSN